MELLRLTGFRSLSEFYEETSALERRMLTKSIEAYHDERGGRAGLGM